MLIYLFIAYHKSDVKACDEIERTIYAVALLSRHFIRLNPRRDFCNMAEPSVKRLKTNLPICKTHRPFLGSRVKQNLPAVVEECLCGVSTLLMEVAYRLEALVRTANQCQCNVVYIWDSIPNSGLTNLKSQ